MEKTAEKYLINSVLRATQILECFSIEKTSFTNAELSKELGLHKSSITRLLYSLEKAGFLEKDIKTGKHSLTTRLFRIGSVYINQVDIHKAAMPLLAELSAHYQETANLGIFHDQEVFYIDRVESAQSIQMKSLVGNRLPAYCTAIGKALLAFMDAEELDRYLQSVKLNPFTPDTITSPSALKEHLKAIKKQGYSIDNMECEPDILSVGAPVMDHTEKVVAGISLAGPSFRMKKAGRLEEIVLSVKETAEKISKRLGHD